MKFIAGAIIAVAALVTVSEPVFADPVEDAIKARRAYYQVVKFNAGKLFGIAKGKIDYDAKAAQTYADNLKSLANLNNSAMWIKGSDNDSAFGKTRALPAIWKSFPEVGEKSNALKSATAELAAVAGKDLDALRSKIGAVGEACKACHTKFRAKEF